MNRRTIALIILAFLLGLLLGPCVFTSNPPAPPAEPTEPAAADESGDPTGP